MRIYRIINNNTSGNQENNILLKFIVNPNLCDELELFDNCLMYDEDMGEYYTYSEAGYNSLEFSVNRLRDCITRYEARDRMDGVDTNRHYIEQARKVLDILEKEIEEAKEANNIYYYMFIV